jgi:hypothetical protein
MLRLAADENLNNDIVRALVRRRPDLDIVRIQDANLSGEIDPLILQWCADNNRVLTHDVKTITKHAYERVAAGKAMPGIVEVPRDIPLGTAIEDILELAQYSLDGEWEGQILYLPLR